MLYSGEESAMYCRGECLRCREVRVTYGNAWIAMGGAILKELVSIEGPEGHMSMLVSNNGAIWQTAGYHYLRRPYGN